MAENPIAENPPAPSPEDVPEDAPEDARAPDGAPLEAALYLVSTPIGNAGDIGRRALDILARADHVACEDTRVTGPFLKRFGISAHLTAYHDHNAAKRRPEIIEQIQNGESVALVSDAGTPLVSDPGYKLVAECVEAGLAVTAVPGPSAPMTALILSGLPTDRFFFQGFLPPKSGARRAALTEIAQVPATLVFMESGPRLAASLRRGQPTLARRGLRRDAPRAVEPPGRRARPVRRLIERANATTRYGPYAPGAPDARRRDRESRRAGETALEAAPGQAGGLPAVGRPRSQATDRNRSCVAVSSRSSAASASWTMRPFSRM